MGTAVSERVAAWTRERRAALCAGADTWHTFDVPELGLPALRFSDGPNGVRGHVFDGEPSVCFPATSALGATWDVRLVEDVGRALAAECRRKDVGVLLAPTVNLQRYPLGGRNFEMFSEDPHLTSRLAVAYIHGLQRSGIGACVKHFVGNESEHDRHTVSSDIDERTLREVYLRPFQAAVRDADVWAMMSAYNRLNGTPTSDDRWLLTSVLRGDWGYTGAVVSDWGGTRSTVEALRAGLDLEMPGPTRRRGRRVLEAIDAGALSESELTCSADNVVRLIERADAAATATRPGDATGDVTGVAHRAALGSLVLLRNHGVLPLPRDVRLAVIGPNAEPGEIQGGGSARVSPTETVSPLAGLGAHPAAASVVYEPGCRIGRHCMPLAAPRVQHGDASGARLELFDQLGCVGQPTTVLQVRSMSQHFYGNVAGVIDPLRFSARLTATYVAGSAGVHRLGLASAGSARLLIDGDLVASTSSAGAAGDTLYGWGSAETVVEVELGAAQAVDVVVEFDRDTDTPLGGVLVGLTPPDPDDLFERAVKAAAAADVAVVVVGLDGMWETEGNDRESFELPGRQDELVSAVAAGNPRTVVVVNAGSPVALPWADEVAAIVHAGYPGQQFGRALAEVLFGDVSPSGKLATTWPQRLDDCAAHGSYPGRDGHVAYAEGLHVGHRHFDRAGLQPQFAFGHGLSYTTFDYGEPVIGPAAGTGAATLALPITNTGERSGAEVVQLYASYPASAVDRPARQLVGFDRVELAPGESATANFVLSEHDVAYWDVDAQRWVTEDVPVTLEVGASSRDLRAAISVELHSVHIHGRIDDQNHGHTRGHQQGEPT